MLSKILHIAVLTPYLFYKRLSKCVLLCILLLCVLPSAAQTGHEISVPAEAVDPVVRFPDATGIPDSIRTLVHVDPQAAYLHIMAHMPADKTTPDYDEWVFEFLLVSGILEIEAGDYEAGKQLCLQAIIQSRKTNSFFVNSSRALNSAGNAFSYQSDYKEAARYYYYAITMAEQDTATADYRGRFYNNMATALMSVYQYDQALTFLAKAELAHKHRNADGMLPSVYSNRGVIYSRQGKLDSAAIFFKQALELARTHRKEQSEIAALINIGGNLIEQGRPADAIPFLKEVLASEKGVNPYYKETNALYMMGVAYIYTGDYTRAQQYLTQALDKAQAYGIPEFVHATHAQLSDLYHQKQDFRQAFLHHQAYVRIKDSIAGKENAAAVNLLEVKYRTAQKDKELVENQLLIREQERMLTNKNIWIGGITLGGVLLTIVLIAVYQKYRHRQRLQKQEILILKKEQEIGRLKAMIQGEEKERNRLARELHDGIGGTLAAVKMSFRAVQKNFSFLEETESFTEAMDMLDIMSNELREAAHNLMPDSIIQNGLPESIRRYCAQIKKGRNLNIECQIYGSFEDMNPDIVISVYRVIQELLHNVIKHAKATKAIVQISLHDDLLSLVLEDDGIGFNPDWERTGIGLKNLRSRIQHMNGRMTIDSSTGKGHDNTTSQTGTSVYVEIDLAPHKKNLT